MNRLRIVWRWLLTGLFRLEVRGAGHLRAEKGGLLVVANHYSRLDPLLLSPFLPEGTIFALHPDSLPGPLWRRFLGWIRFVVHHGDDEAGSKRLIGHLRAGKVVALFPEGVPSGSGSLAKINDWAARVASRAAVPTVAVHLHGGQHHVASRREPGLRRRRFPPVTVTVLRPSRLGDGAGKAAGERTVIHWLTDRLATAWLADRRGREGLWQALCRAAREQGRGRRMLTDATGQHATYGQIITRSWILGGLLARDSRAREVVGVLLPTTVAAILTFFALHSRGRVPAMLNFTVGPGPLLSACRTARIKRIHTSRRFVEKARLRDTVAALEAAGLAVCFLEDLAGRLTLWHKVAGALGALLPLWSHRRANVDLKPADPAAVLFTSGSEGEPKGVVLSHDNLLSNTVQIQTRIDLRTDDRILNILPMFHAFGLTFGALGPLLAGVPAHCYPSPLEYRRIPKLAREQKTTLLVGTDTFLSGYGRTAEAGDFAALRYVFAGAEPLREATRRQWRDRFGLNILEGYGATETGPALAINTPHAQRPGSVGRILPGVAVHLEPVPGVAEGGELWVRGDNVMIGYLRPGGDGTPEPPATRLGSGWYATGDVVRLDEEGFLYIIGRVKRFAKIGGEMVSLATVEALVSSVWPDHPHAVVSEPDPRKGERLVLVTEHPRPRREALMERAREEGLGGLYIPGRILSVPTMPRLATGKIDLKGVAAVSRGG